MPTPKQMEKLAEVASNGLPAARPLGPADEMPPEYWRAVLDDVSADARPPAPAPRERKLSEMSDHLLRVSCRRCERTVETQRADSVRLYGPDAVWKQVRQRLLDDTCQQRTGRYEEDGCWPSFET